MKEDEDVDMSWVQLARGAHAPAVERAAKRELSPLIAPETTIELKRVKLDGDETVQASAPSSYDEKKLKAQARKREINEQPKLETVDINFREYAMTTAMTTSYLLDMSRPIEDPPILGYEEFQGNLEASEKRHDRIYKLNPPFQTKLFDLVIEKDLLSQYANLVDERKSVLGHADQTTDFGFYEMLQEEIWGDWLSVLREYWDHKERGKHLRHDTDGVVKREKRQEAERLAASQVAAEAHSPSSDAYEDCLEDTTISPTNDTPQSKKTTTQTFTNALFIANFCLFY